MSGTTAILRGLAAALAVLGACAAWVGCETPLEKAWTRSYTETVERSIANPKAGEHDLEAPRTDGISTDAALVKFRTRETQTPEETNTSSNSLINVDIGD